METKGYYSVIRFVPDAFRGEGVNLGVILLAPEHKFLEWTITNNHQRARRFFQDEADVVRLKLLGRGLSERLTAERRLLLDPDGFRSFALRHQDMLQLTAPRTCAIGQPVNELAKLFSRLVEHDTKTTAGTAALTALQVRAQTQARFRDAGVLSRLDTDVEFPARYRPHPYQFSFGYQNGGPYKVIHATSFAVKDPDESCERALVLLGEFNDIRRNQSAQPVEFQVVGAFASSQAQVRRSVQMAFDDSKVKLWVPNEIDPLIDQIREDTQ